MRLFAFGGPHSRALRVVLAAESRPVVLRYFFQCGCPSPCVVCLCPGQVNVCHICRARLLFTETLCGEFLSEIDTPGLTCLVARAGGRGERAPVRASPGSWWQSWALTLYVCLPVRWPPEFPSHPARVSADFGGPGC